MAKLANPKVVGEMPCDSQNCNEIMEVRQRSNGRKLLYTYCPNCKVDQRSGDEIQSYWRNNMKPVGTTQSNQPINTVSPTKVDRSQSVEIEEWRPDEPEELNQNTPNDQDEQSGNSGWFGKFLLGAAGFCLLIAGVRGAN